VRTNNKQVQPEYLSWFINSKTGQNYFKDRSNTTSGLNTISTGIVSEMPVYIPSLVLQKRFAAIVHRHERIRVQQREGLRQAEYLFQSLLHQAFGQA
jgi:type I restriction enzyme S subunit